MGKNNNHANGILLYHKYLSKHYELIAMDLSKKNWIRKPWFKTTN